MAANVAVASQQVIAYVRRAAQMDRLAALGLEPTTEVSGLFDCELVISMLPDDAAVREWYSAERTSAFPACLRD
jgi:3-hydroxyisobutyrate dehydrogenase-like beta-hydroxyacid dehydrogenase